MFFEGAEKKIEIIVSRDIAPLTEKPRAFWESLVSKCEATILSDISNSEVHAYLLSESSLFVWSDRILMLTCGQTKLVESAEFFIKTFGAANIEGLFFQRKNEYRSQLQPSDFRDDVMRLGEIVDGEVVRFGKLHSHHTLLFHSSKKIEDSQEDKTTELLMYDMAPEVIEFLTNESLSKEALRNFFKLENVFEGFEFDDFVFKPYGYSLNGIKDGQYLTVHVTPQDTCPYVSFETNLLICEKSQIILQHFIEVLKPGSFDVLNFNCRTELSFGSTYTKTIHVQDSLSIPYDVDFYYFNKQQEQPEKIYRYSKVEDV